MLRFDCALCKHQCEAAPEFAGKTVVCPNCHQATLVPKDAAAVTAKPRVALPSFPSTSLTTPEVAEAQQAKKRARGGDADLRQPSVTKGAGTGGNPLKYLIVAALGVGLIVVIFGAWMGPANQTEPEKPVGGRVKPVDVVMETSKGTITMELYPDKAPISVANFLKYVDKKHYDGTTFHRVIKTFMIQGGGMAPGGREKPTMAPIKNEGGNGLKNVRASVAMARTGVPDSATSQFFINVVDNSFLDRANAQDRVGYAVFGRVIDGMEVVDDIRYVQTGQGDVPVEDVLIKSIRRADPQNE